MTSAGPLLPQGYRVVEFATIGSTNDEAKSLARDGAAAGTVVWARQQQDGRGRRGRFWASPPGNLYLSLIARPPVAPAAAAQLGFAAAIGVGDAILELAGSGLPISCKWPNDILADGRKLAGILLESETSASGSVDFVVIGVGVNIAVAPQGLEYKATSLLAEGAGGIAPATLLHAFLHHYDRWAARWRQDGFAPLREAWLARAGGLGEEIRVRLERLTLAGRFRDLDPDGALVLETADGTRRIAAGEIFPAC